MLKDLYQIVVWIQFSYHFKEVQEGKDQEKAQSEKDSPKTEVGKETNNQVLIP